MEVRIKGQMTIADIRQALFEQLHELETKYAVQFPVAPRSTSIRRMVSVRTSRPACQAGMSSEPYTAWGHTAAQLMRGSYERGCSYHSGSESETSPGHGRRCAMKEPCYIDLEEARRVLAEMGVALSPRQMKRAADLDARGRRKLPFFIDPIEGRLKIEKGTLVRIYRDLQMKAENGIKY